MKTLLWAACTSLGKCSFADWLKIAMLRCIGSFRTGYDAVRIFCAIVLLVAAGLKCYQLSTEPTLGNSFLENRWLLMAAVEAELFFGFWLISGLLPKKTWLATVGCFGLFASVSLYKALFGYATCGCFGTIKVNPWYTTTFDFAVVLSLLRWQPHGLCTPPRFARSATVLAAWLLLGLLAAYAMGSYVGTTLSAAGEIVGNGKIVVLEPEKWVGKRFPLLDYIDIGDKLKEGKWLVLLYHHDCQKCQEAIAKLTKTKESAAIVCVEVPPCEKNSKNLPLAFAAAKLRADREWFASTPVTLRIVSGRVTEVTE